MKQFKTILGFELKNYYKNKVFVGITLLLVVVIGIVMFIPNIFSSDEEDIAPSEGDNAVMLIGADDASLLEISKSYFTDAFIDYDVRTTNDSEDSIKSAVSEGRAECAFLLSGNSYKYFVNVFSMYDANTAIADEILTTVYRMNAMVNEGLSPEDASNIMGISVVGEVVSLGKAQEDTFFYTYIMIFALYMVIILYGQMVATSVATEKSSRAMELLITSARPVSMMFGKVFAACIAGLCQLGAIFGSALLFFNLNKSAWEGNMIIESIFNIPPALLVYMLVFFLLGFLIYAFLYGAIGSTASKLEDLNTAVLPLTYLFIIAFIVVMTSMSSGEVDNILMKVCSYIPFTSPMAMFTRIAMSTVPIYEIIISIIILVGSVIGIGVLSARIYKVGVLLYGTKPNIFKIVKEIFKK